MMIKFCKSADLEIIHLTRFPSYFKEWRNETQKAFKFQRRLKYITFYRVRYSNLVSFYNKTKRLKKITFQDNIQFSFLSNRIFCDVFL